MTVLFSSWTPAERWLAGLLWADGHLVTSSTGHVILAQSDESVIDMAASIIGPGHHRYPPQSGRNSRTRTLHRLGLHDHQGALQQLGFGPKPDRIWPGQLASGAFLRGLFDGDGSVGRYTDKRDGPNTYLQSAMSSPYAVLDGMQSWLSDLGISPKKVKRNGNGWQVQWSAGDSGRLAEIMYGEPGPCMARKRAVFEAAP